MFTGIVEAVGKISVLERRGGATRLQIDAGAINLSDAKPGDSIAVSGACLTIVALAGNTFAVDASTETLSCTIVGDWKVGARVNLEQAMLPTTRLGGHLVSGHVDGVGVVRSRDQDGASIRLRITAPKELARFIAQKGSICVDGVSLTVNAVDGAAFDVNIIPHTGTQTTLGDVEVGRRVNLEVDLVARYLERLLCGEHAADTPPTMTREWLAHHGFLR